MLFCCCACYLQVVLCPVCERAVYCSERCRLEDKQHDSICGRLVAARQVSWTSLILHNIIVIDIAFTCGCMTASVLGGGTAGELEMYLVKSVCDRHRHCLCLCLWLHPAQPAYCMMHTPPNGCPPACTFHVVLGLLSLSC